MSSVNPPRLARWLLTRLISDDALIGDVLEQYQSRRSATWLVRQVFFGTFQAVRRHPVLALGAVVFGWAFLWTFFRFVGGPLGRLDAYLFTMGFVKAYSPWWWWRSMVMWLVLGFTFFSSGWLVARLASAARMPVVLAFALSVSAAIATVLVLDEPANSDLWMWLTVPLFLMVAPATMIVVGGLAASRKTAR